LRTKADVSGGEKLWRVEASTHPDDVTMAFKRDVFEAGASRPDFVFELPPFT
jgi:hypothetical protein